MNHLIICREYPPAPHAAGGIGTYVFHIARLLAEAGETIHVISQLWDGAPRRVEKQIEGRLIVHRIPYGRTMELEEFNGKVEALALLQTDFPRQAFSWNAALHAEKLIEDHGIDLIEAQEFEAPLYYFQIRRALGLGPKQTPPCLIHMHSPTEFIARANERDPNYGPYRTARRLEAFSMSAADSLLCASRYMAQQMEEFLGLEDGAVRIIPYPLGNSKRLDRTAETWREGSICYVGRLEHRKGILEWIDAAVTVLEEHPYLRFEFAGANVLQNGTLTGEEILKRRIPDRFKNNFLFHGEKKLSFLSQLLSRARIAAVPSRWENFPNTCMEAMASGLPVLATQQGGMAEMMEDRRTGWLTRTEGAEGLAEALVRAVQTTPEKLEEMGNQAALDIQRICDPKRILQAHHAYRREMIAGGTQRSRVLPAMSAGKQTAALRTSKQDGEGIAVIVSESGKPRSLENFLENLKQQTLQPAALVPVRHQEARDPVRSKNEAVAELLQRVPKLAGFIFLHAEDVLIPDALELLDAILRRRPETGLFSFWVQDPNHTVANPCPAFPYQWVRNEAVPCSAIRTEALLEAGVFRSEMAPGFEAWDLFNAVMAAGWGAVTIPAILCKSATVSHMGSDQDIARMRSLMLERFPDLARRDAAEIALLIASDAVSLQKHGAATRRDHFMSSRLLRLARRAKRSMGIRTPGWILRMIRKSASKQN